MAKNGGVPQAADIDAHAASVADTVAAKIPDAAFSGLLILDFEGWRPAATADRSTGTPMAAIQSLTATRGARTAPGARRLDAHDS